MNSSLDTETNRRILVVDDEQSIRLGIKLALSQSSDWEIDTEASPSTALKLLKSKHYDAMILDLRMPEMDGLTLARMQSDQGIFCPTVLSSAFANTDIVLSAILVGIVDFMTKPMDLTELRATVQHLLWRHRRFSNLHINEIKELSLNNQYECAKYYLQQRNRVQAKQILLDLLEQKMDENSELLLGIIAELEKSYDLAERYYTEACSRGKKPPFKPFQSKLVSKDKATEKRFVLHAKK